MNIVSRQQWGAKPPRSRHTIALPTRHLFLHHTAGSEPDGADGVRRIQNFHMGPQRGWADIAYSFLVDRQGAVFEGRGAGVAGAHTQGYNTTGHAICVVGHYDQQRPTTVSLDAIADLVRHGRGQGWWPGKITAGHRDVGSTSCPGEHLYAQIPTINRLARQEDDMPAPKDWDADDWDAFDRHVASRMVRHTERNQDWHTRRIRDMAERSYRAAVAGLEGLIGEIRADVGLDPSPEWDGIHARRVADGAYGLAEVRRRLEDAA